MLSKLIQWLFKCNHTWDETVPKFHFRLRRCRHCLTYEDMNGILDEYEARLVWCNTYQDFQARETYYFLKELEDKYRNTK